ncbi:MAG: RsmF rRNA methyltransferase first C-terminal domain-containing protein [Chloroflexota bacterium]|nr:RsmF rRNA methyltransferase first C-terminal domain-containing protein [Chloroflexota bacterium]
MENPPLPQAFVASVSDQLGAAAEPFLATYADPPAHGLRVNPARTTLDELRARTGWDLEPIPWCPDGAYVDPAVRAGAHPFHAAGLYYLQEPTAMAVAEFADLAPAMTVLDLAAAPGGKSTAIASAIGPAGLLVANEIHPARIKPLGENLERWGVTNTVITNRTPESLAALGPVFERVVVDAPCSGEGLFRRDPDARREWSPERVRGSADRQLEILRAALPLVAPGGALVYSTCTFNTTENEEVVERILAEFPAFRLAATMRLWPHEVRGEGHAMTRLVHTGEPASEWVGFAPAPSYRGDAWSRFVADTLTADPVERWGGRVIEREGRLTLQPVHPLVESIGRTVRAGLWLGDIKPGRFEPSHALALALDPADARNRLDLTIPEARAWIAGETVQSPGPAGWLLVTVEGHPLGWGKRTGATVKNHYPKGLRRAVRREA